MKKSTLTLCLALCAIVIAISAYITPSYRYEPNNVIYKKKITVSKASNVIDTFAYVEIGADSGAFAAFQLHITDSVKIGTHKKAGTFYYNYRDSSLWYYNGKLHKRVGAE
jgi:hypothetical protein